MKKWILPLILVLVFGGLMAFAYFKIEKPIDSQLEKQINLSIYSQDEWGSLISTGFEVYLDNSLFEKGSTLSQAPIRYLITNNSYVKIINVNQGKQNYYTDVKEYRGFEKDIVRVDLDLIKPSYVISKRVNSLENGSEIVLNLTTSKLNKGTHACIKYTTHFVYVKMNETQLEEPFSDYDKCFNLNVDLNKTNNKIIYLEYKIWGNLDHKDYIEVAFVDTENGVGYDIDKKDLFAPNSFETFGINNI